MNQVSNEREATDLEFRQEVMFIMCWGNKINLALNDIRR